MNLPRPSMLAIVTILLASAAARAADTPALVLVPRASRTRAEGVGPIPAWDNRWWIDVQVPHPGTPLARVEYRARFGDASGNRPVGGGWEVAATDRDGFVGRVEVTCIAPTDYDRPVHIEMRLRDVAGGAGEWSVVDFPVNPDASATPPTPPRQADGAVLSSIFVDVDDGATIGDIKAALQRQAVALGGDAAGFRMMGSSGTQSRFAADVVHHASTAPPATPTLVPATDRVIGEIVLPATRR